MDPNERDNAPPRISGIREFLEKLEPGRRERLLFRLRELYPFPYEQTGQTPVNPHDPLNIEDVTRTLRQILIQDNFDTMENLLAELVLLNDGSQSEHFSRGVEPPQEAKARASSSTFQSPGSVKGTPSKPPIYHRFRGSPNRGAIPKTISPGKYDYQNVFAFPTGRCSLSPSRRVGRCRSKCANLRTTISPFRQDALKTAMVGPGPSKIYTNVDPEPQDFLMMESLHRELRKIETMLTEAETSFKEHIASIDRGESGKISNAERSQFYHNCRQALKNMENVLQTYKKHLHFEDESHPSSVNTEDQPSTSSADQPGTSSTDQPGTSSADQSDTSSSLPLCTETEKEKGSKKKNKKGKKKSPTEDKPSPKTKGKRY